MINRRIDQTLVSIPHPVVAMAICEKILLNQREHVDLLTMYRERIYMQPHVLFTDENKVVKDIISKIQMVAIIFI